MGWGRSEEGYTWLYPPSLSLGSSGPTRVDTNNADPDYRPRPVGFTANLGNAKPVTRNHTSKPEQKPITPAGRCPECRDVAPHHFRYCTRGDT